MFRLIDSVIGILLIVILIKVFMPQDISDLVGEIFFKVLSLIDEILAQAAI